MAVAERHGRVMASRLHVVAVDAPGRQRPDAVTRALDRAVASLEHLERCWSRFIPTSDISRINQLGPAGGRLVVDPSTLTLLAAMIEGYERTVGRFDPTVLPALIAEGRDGPRPDGSTSTPAPVGSLLDVAIDPSTNSLEIPAGLVLDPGGVGKGLAADLTVGLLLDLGLGGALVEIGGDLAMGGQPLDPVGWVVDVEHPDPVHGVVCSLAITGGGVATSSVRSRRWWRDGVERHHQIDPATGVCSMTDLTAVTVVAPSGWLAEVHATAALAAGSAGVLAYLDGHGLSGLAVRSRPAGDQTWTTDDLAGVPLRTRSEVR